MLTGRAALRNDAENEKCELLVRGKAEKTGLGHQTAHAAGESVVMWEVRTKRRMGILCRM